MMQYLAPTASSMFGAVSPVKAPDSSKYTFCAPSAKGAEAWSMTSETPLRSTVGGQTTTSTLTSASLSASARP